MPPHPTGSPGSDDDDLQASLSDLAGLVAGTQGLHHQLTSIAGFAHRAVPGADGAGVTLLKDGNGEHKIEALAASAEFVSSIDAIQYTVLNEGPCISAARERRTVRSGSLGGEPRWPRFGPRVGRLGVHSVLSLPLLIAEQVVGAINVYAHEKNAFDDRATEFGEQFAVPAAVAVHNAHVLEHARVLTAQLQAALTSRPIIDQAIGLIRGRTGANADEAFDRLRKISQRDNVKLALVAQHVVDEAVGRARARHGATPLTDQPEPRSQ